LRNDRHSDTRADHPAHGIEASKAHAEFERPPGSDRVLTEMELESVRRGQADEFLIEQGLEEHATTTPEGMVSRRDEDELIGREGEGLKISEIDDVRDDADIDESLRHRSDDVVARVLLEIDIDPGMACKERFESLRQELGERRCIRLHADPALQAAGMLRQFALHVLDLLERALSMMDEGLAGRREGDAAPAAFEQGDARKLFHLPDAAACRCERHMGHLGAARDARAFCDMEKQLQIDEIEAHRPISCFLPSRQAKADRGNARLSPLRSRIKFAECTSITAKFFRLS
jgi:hypothetical protein